jgi:hypothetical protein
VMPRAARLTVLNVLNVLGIPIPYWIQITE